MPGNEKWEKAGEAAEQYIRMVYFKKRKAFPFHLEGFPVMRTFSREARERPYRTVEAARVLREKATVVERATGNAQFDEVIVAVIRSDLSFGGVWIFARQNLLQQIHTVEDEGGWSLTFSPNTPAASIEQRCDELARIAQKRGEVMQRWLQRHDER